MTKDKRSSVSPYGRSARLDDCRSESADLPKYAFWLMKGSEKRLRKAQRTAINAFLIFHIFSIACWGLPMSNPLANVYRSWVRPYFLWAGLFQSWDMFSPSPKAINSYVDAIVL